MRRKKRTQDTNLKRMTVSSAMSEIRKTKHNHNGVIVTSPEETASRKRNFLDILDLATEQITKNLKEGKMELTSSYDIERIIKLTLLVSGEAESIQGNTDTTETEQNKLTMSKVDRILDENDPEVQAMYQKLFTGYNEENDKAGDE